MDYFGPIGPQQSRHEPTVPRAFGFTALGVIAACSVPLVAALLSYAGSGGWIALLGAVTLPSLALWMAARLAPVYVVAYVSGGCAAVAVFVIWLVHEIATTPWFTF